MNEISAHMKEATETSFALMACEDTARSWLSMNQEAGSPDTKSVSVLSVTQAC